MKTKTKTKKKQSSAAREAPAREAASQEILSDRMQTIGAIPEIAAMWKMDPKPGDLFVVRAESGKVSYVEELLQSVSFAMPGVLCLVIEQDVDCHVVNKSQVRAFLESLLVEEKPAAETSVVEAAPATN